MHESFGTLAIKAVSAALESVNKKRALQYFTIVEKDCYVSAYIRATCSYNSVMSGCKVRITCMHMSSHLHMMGQ